MARILVVDDDPSIRELTRTILSIEGHEITEAANGRQALDLIGMPNGGPDLIVLDLAMPEMDGWHFLEELYVRGLRRSVRVVIVSANLDNSRHENARTLPKPFEPGALVTLVSEALMQDPAEMYERRERSAELARLLARVDRVVGTP